MAEDWPEIASFPLIETPSTFWDPQLPQSLHLRTTNIAKIVFNYRLEKGRRENFAREGQKEGALRHRTGSPRTGGWGLNRVMIINEERRKVTRHIEIRFEQCSDAIVLCSSGRLHIGVSWAPLPMPRWKHLACTAVRVSPRAAPNEEESHFEFETEMESSGGGGGGILVAEWVEHCAQVVWSPQSSEQYAENIMNIFLTCAGNISSSEPALHRPYRRPSTPSEHSDRSVRGRFHLPRK